MTDKVVCAICGKHYKSLSSHLRKHSISAKEYVDIYNSPIISEDLKNSKRDKMLLYNAAHSYKHTEESKAKMGGPRPSISGSNNPFKKKYDNDLQFKERFRQKHLDIWQSRDFAWRRDFSEKLSRSMTESTNLNKNIHKYHINNHWLSDKCMLGGYLRSSWEIYFASVLDVSPLVSHYEIETVIVPYYDFLNSKDRYTKVDFLVYFYSGERVLVEIKPSSLISNNLYKILGVECFCLENNLQFFILSEDCINNYTRLSNFLQLLSNGDLYLSTFIAGGKTTPLCCSMFLEV